MFCSHCGNNLRGDAKFCNKCGVTTEDTSSQPQQSAVGTAQPANTGGVRGNPLSDATGSPGPAPSAEQPQPAHPESPLPTPLEHAGVSPNSSGGAIVPELHPDGVLLPSAASEQAPAPLMGAAGQAGPVPAPQAHDNQWRIPSPVLEETTLPTIGQPHPWRESGSAPEEATLPAIGQSHPWRESGSALEEATLPAIGQSHPWPGSGSAPEAKASLEMEQNKPWLTPATPQSDTVPDDEAPTVILSRIPFGDRHSAAQENQPTVPLAPLAPPPTPSAASAALPLAPSTPSTPSTASTALPLAPPPTPAASTAETESAPTITPALAVAPTGSTAGAENYVPTAPLPSAAPTSTQVSEGVAQSTESAPPLSAALGAASAPVEAEQKERIAMATEPTKDTSPESAAQREEPVTQETLPSTAETPPSSADIPLDPHSPYATPTPGSLPAAVPAGGNQPPESPGVAAQEMEPQPAGQGGADWSPLTVGHDLQGRYKIEAVTQTTPTLNTYTVSDQRAYEKCWNCGSTEGHPSDKFCPDCGASLYGHTYVLTELPGGAPQSALPAALIVAQFEENGRSYLVSRDAEPEENYFPFGVTLLVGAKSEAGRERAGDPNEDSILTLQFSRIHESKVEPFGIFVVADGMGGHDNGQEASKQAISVMAQNLVQGGLLKLLQEGSLKEDYLTDLLRDAILKTNESLVQENHSRHTDMGTTMTAAIIHGNIAHIANVGDSRTYLLDDQHYRPVTTDHSLVASLVAAGMIKPEEVYTHPQRNQIYRSLGDKRELQVDTFIQKLTPNATLVLCSDGMWEMTHDPEMEQILRAAPHPQAAAEQLVKAANAHGGEDNVSVIVVKALATAPA